MKNRSLKFIIDIFIVLFLIIGIGFTVINIENITNTLKEMQKEKISLIVKNNAPVINQLIKFEFYDELKDQIKDLVNVSDDIEGMKIITPGHKFFYFESEKYDSLYTYKLNENITVFVYYNTNNILSRFYEKFFNRFFLYILIFTPLAFYIFIYIRNKIKKFNILAKNVESMDFRRVKHVALIDSFYEIVNITNAINKLLNRVNLFYETQKNMIRRVMKLKKHLETAQKIAQSYSWEYDCVNKEIKISNEFRKFLGINKNKPLSIDEFNKFFLEKDIFSILNESCEKCVEFEIEHKIITLKNKEYDFKTIGKCIKTQKTHYILGVSLNITESVKKQKTIEFLAFHDALTGLPNRRKLIERFNFLKSLADREHKKIAVLYLDMDNFKMINDTLGHKSGDELLVNIANKLKSSLRKTDFIARIGGDEFVILLYGLKSNKEAIEVAKKVIDLLNRPVNIKNTNIIPTFSIGGTVYPDDADNFEDLLKFADIAMYEVKEKGKNSIALIDEKIKKSSSEFYKIVDELKNALKNKELVLYFQPKIDVSKNRVYGAEGLIRWNHPKKGILTPFHFIPYAEKSGLISKIDDYVLEYAFKTLKKWEEDEKLKDLTLAINISANKFKQENFVNTLNELLKTYNIDPAKLEIEITETLSMDNIDYTINVLKQIKVLGFKIALDDFGTGYSSLNYLKKIPFDTLKVDQSFVMDLADDKDDLVITEMIIQIAKVLKKKTVAEGVENEKILNIVRKLGCNLIQGYYFGKPMDEKSFVEFCKNFPHK